MASAAYTTALECAVRIQSALLGRGGAAGPAAAGPASAQPGGAPAHPPPALLEDLLRTALHVTDSPAGVIAILEGSALRPLARRHPRGRAATPPEGTAHGPPHPTPVDAAWVAELASGGDVQRCRALPGPLAALLPGVAPESAALVLPVRVGGSTLGAVLLAGRRRGYGRIGMRPLEPLRACAELLLAAAAGASAEAPRASATPTADAAPPDAAGLRRLQRILHTVLEAFPYHLYVKDRDLRYRMISRAFAENSSLSREQMLGRTLGELGYLSPAEQAALTAQDRKVIETGQPVTLPEFRFTLPDGQEVYQTVLKVPLHDDAGRVEGLIGIAMHTTDAVRARLRAEERQRLLDAVLDAIPHGLSVKDAAGRFILVNEAFRRNAGRPREDLLGLGSAELGYVDAPTVQVLRELDARVLREGRAIESEDLPFTFADGRRTIQHVIKAPLPGPEGRPAGVVTVAMDVTARVEAERLLRTVLDALPYSLAVKDREGRYLMVNRAFAEFTGATPGALLGGRAEDVRGFDADLLARIREADRTVIEEGRRVELRDAPRRKPDGGMAFDHIYKTPLFGRDGEIVGIISAAEDITVRKRAAEELQAGQRLLRTVLDTIPHSITVQDRNARFVVVNETFARRAGMPMERLVGAGVADLHYMTAESRETIIAADRQVLDSGAPVELPEQAFVQQDGSVAYRNVFKAPLRDSRDAVAGLVSIAVDITQRVRAQQQVRDSERLLKAMFDTIPHLVALKNREGRYEMINPAYQAVFGKPAETFLGRLPQEIPELTASAGAQFASSDERVLAEVRSIRDEQTVPLEDGSVRHFDVYKTALLDGVGQPERIVSVALDVTERREAEERAQLAHARLQDAVESLPAVFMLFDPDERLLMWNRHLTEYFPESAGRVHAGMRYEDIVRLAAPHQRAATGDPDYVDTRLREFRRAESHTLGQRADGRWIQYHDLRTRDGGTVSLRFDVTELKTREQELRQAQKMEAVGQLTGGVAHDFNNLLTVILGNLDMLRRTMLDEEPATRLIERSLDAVERGAGLTQRLLAFSRSQTLQPQATDLNRLVLGMHELLLRTLGETVTIEARLAPELWPTLIDPAQMENALLNLAINARDAMPHGGRLVLETRNHNLRAEEVAGHDGVQPGAYAMLAVRDTGVGMPPELIERVFDPFFTTKEAGKGSGLGLSMVYGFVRQSAGHVAIESEPGQGATVRVYLPRAPVEAAAPLDAAIVDALPRGHGEQVLVVEDDPHIARLARELIDELGYTTLEAGDAATALAVLEQEPGVALLFTDVVLPGGRSGIDLALQARARRPGLRVLFTTGYAEHERMEQTLTHLGALLLEKPYRRTELARLLRRTLQHGEPDAPQPQAVSGSVPTP